MTVSSKIKTKLTTKIKAFTSIFILLTITACTSTSTTQIDYVKTTDFSEFNSFQFVESNNSNKGSNPVLNLHIRNAIENKLTLQQFISQDTDADLQIKFRFTQTEKPNNSSFSIGIGGAKIGGSGGASVGVSTNIPIESDATYITKIMIDISHEGKAVWFGSDSYEAKGNISPLEKEQLISETVNRLLTNFPPEKGAQK